MPMDFPDLESLEFAAKIHKFREFRTIDPRETEDAYRTALADHVKPRDFIESEEIRNKVGWDQWDDNQTKDMLRRGGFNI